MDVALAAGMDPSARALQGQAYADRLKAIILEPKTWFQHLKTVIWLPLKESGWNPT
jgi:hypothetical protein